MIAASGFLTALEYIKFEFGQGTVLDLAGGTYSAPPDSLPGLRRPTFTGKGGKETGKEGEGGEVVEEGQGTGKWKGSSRDARERGGSREEGEECKYKYNS